MVDFILVFALGGVGVGIAVIGCLLALVNKARRPDHEDRIRQLEEEVEACKSKRSEESDV